MVEEQIERRSQILQAALNEFAHKGFKGATIKSIAKAANLQSPTLIYWYFPTKEALFQAVLEEQSPLMQATADPSALFALPPETVLPLLARGYLNSIDTPASQQVFRLLLMEIAQRPELASSISGHFMPRVLNFLRQYFEQQIASGYFRPHDTRSSARAFMGMLIPQVLGKVLFPVLRADNLSDEEHIGTAIEIFLRGLRTSPTGDQA
jgi:TetR/AcrR family transcriptional regulator